MDKNSLMMTYSVDKTFASDKFLKLRCRVCHDGESPNKTYFTKAVMEAANQELEYIPILAHVYTNKDGVPTIGAHDTHIEEDKLNDGENKVIYDEQPIGMVPSVADNNCTIEEFEGLNYTYVDAYVWRDYANYAEQLVEDAENVKLSMEIDYPTGALSYDAENERYVLSSYRYRGITLLNDSFGTGMKKALATTANFSANEDIKDTMIILMEELQKCLREYNKKNSDEKGGEKVMNKFEELLNQYGKTIEEVTFEYENLSDDELEVAFREAFTDNKHDDDGVNPEDGISTEPDVTDANSDNQDDGQGDPSPNGNDEFTLIYKLSHDDIRSALYNLLAATSDSYQWIVEVYDNDFIYQDYESNKFFRCGYSRDGDIISLGDNTTEVFSEWLSQKEKEALDSLKNNYSVLEGKYNDLKAFKDNYDATLLKTQKDAIFAKVEYECLADNADFQKLISEAEQYSVDEISTKADLIFAAHMKSTMDFGAKNTDSNKTKTMGLNYQANIDKNTDKKPYGNLFD